MCPNVSSLAIVPSDALLATFLASVSKDLFCFIEVVSVARRFSRESILVVDEAEKEAGRFGF